MPLDTAEGIEAAFKGLALGQDVLDRVKQLPPAAEAKAVDYARAFGADENGPQMKLAQLIDQVRADIED
jgi:hypothetical protein